MGLSSDITLARSFEEDYSGKEVCWNETAIGKHKNVLSFLTRGIYLLPHLAL